MRKNAKNQCAPLVCGFNFVYILYERFNNITVLKVLVLSLYNSVLNTCARDSHKRRRRDVPEDEEANENVCPQQSLLDLILAFTGNIEYKFSTHILNSKCLHENVYIAQH